MRRRLGSWLHAGVCASLTALCAPAQADEASDRREAEMFGVPSVVPDAVTAPPPDPTIGVHEAAQEPGTADVAQDRHERVLGELAERSDKGNDYLDIGGFFFLRSEFDIVDDQALQLDTITSPNLLDFYFDARPNNRVRGYFRGRVTYNPAVTNGQLSPLTGTAQQQTALILDQFWLKFDMARTIFATMGRQPIRWGAGRFWNPTDFLNKQHRDPLAIFDERVGVTMLKLNLPFESQGWNLYGVVNLTDATTPHDVGGGLRAEVLVEQTEFALTAYTRKGGPLQFGLDASSGIGLFDVRVEASLQHGVTQNFYQDANLAAGIPPATFRKDKEWLVQVVAGADLTLRYSDDDTITLGSEYFYNQLGYDNPDYDVFAILDFVKQGLAPPFLYLGRHYISCYAMLAKPGSWNNTTVTLSLIGNLTDKSFVSRLDWQVRVLTYMDVNFYGAYDFGHHGEFRLAAPENLGVVVPKFLGDPSLDTSQFVISTPHAQVGVGLRLYF